LSWLVLAGRARQLRGNFFVLSAPLSSAQLSDIIDIIQIAADIIAAISSSSCVPSFHLSSTLTVGEDPDN
jgi:hypothetical protein